MGDPAALARGARRGRLGVAALRSSFGLPGRPASATRGAESIGMQAKESEVEAETTRAAGRGGLAIAVAKVSFILFGFAQQVVLPRLLQEDGYGEVSLVLSVVSIVNNVVVA